MTNHPILALKAYHSDVAIHRHSAYQVVFTTDHPFHSTFEGKRHTDIYGFIIKPQVAHSCECSNSNLIIINIEPYSFLGKHLAKKLGDAHSKAFYSSAEFGDFLELQNPRFTYTDIIHMNEKEVDQPLIDERISRSVAYIGEHFRSDKCSLNDLAQHVFLSPSRLAFLFKQQLGSSITKFLLWARLRNAIFLILSESDKSITSIALESGFYDSSQMNKYMYEMFGIAPLKLRQKSDLIQFLETGSD